MQLGKSDGIMQMWKMQVLMAKSAKCNFQYIRVQDASVQAGV